MSVFIKRRVSPETLITLRRLGMYLAKHKPALALAMVLTIISHLFLLAGPVLIGFSIDQMAQGPGNVNFEKIYQYLVILFVLFACSSLFQYWLATIMITVSQNISRSMREEAFSTLQILPVDYFHHHKTGDIISRITYDIDTINSSLTHDAIQVFATLVTIIGSFVMMIYVSPYLALLFSVTIPLSFLFAFYKTKRLRPLYRKRSEALGALNGFMEEKISGQKIIKVYHQEENILNSFSQKNQKAAEANFNADFQGGIVQPAMNFLNNISLSLTGLAGSLFYLYGFLSIGSISSFILYSRKFSGPINETANILNDLQSALAAAQRVFAIIDQQAEDGFAEQPGTIKTSLLSEHGSIDFSEVDFSYDTQKALIKDLSFEAAQGKMIAIVGPTGSGKTTIINLLLRFYNPQKGQISLNNKPASGIHKEHFRSLFSVVLQDSWMFYGSIYDNLIYGNSKVSKEQAKKICQDLGLDDFIMSLPEGYDTNIIEKGIDISQGQKQCLSIARAIIADKPFLILDEATSNVDTQTEYSIQQALKTMLKDKTCFIIAHRLSTIQHADKILVIKNGKIVETGTHKELLAAQGDYFTLSQYQLIT